ncbi:MAG: BrnT family toxin [Rhodanobacter sp.]
MHISFVGVEYDSAKAEANKRKHGVSFADAEQALRDPNAATMEDPDAEDEPRFVTLGMDAAGRLLLVVWTPRGDRVRVVSARKASRQETNIYAQ